MRQLDDRSDHAAVPASPKVGPDGRYTSDSHEVPTKTTKPNINDVLTLTRAGWGDMTDQGVRTLAAQCLHETKDGSNCFNWNLGNVKTLTPSVMHMYLKNVWELTSAYNAGREVAAGEGLAHIATGAELAKYAHGSQPW